MRKYIGNKAFYAMVFAVLIPIIIQNSISNFVNLLDNLMVGAVGTEEMSGVAIANQLMMVYNLSIFGGLSGAGIFTAQFFGSKNDGGVRETVRIKLLVMAFLTAVFLLIFAFFSKDLIALYLTDGEGAGDLEKTLGYGMDYFKI
ncbi:MAG: MATE family efflux transporter, partial [Clostridia bacterium]|nr:MATE family efflux transporter [Clostridia bacterium]